jgi:peroxiredoxin
MEKLQPHLDQITEQTRRLVQPERLAPSERAVAELFASGIENQVLSVGATAPEFVLRDSNHKSVRSADLLALGPVILKFFRGRWCPYCVAELNAWCDAYPAVRDLGALMVAITPQTVHQNDLMVQQHPLPFPVLSDPGGAVAESYGLLYQISEAQQRHYRSMLVNLPFINGDKSWRLPLPATYIVRQDGTIAFARAYADFRVRPEPDEVLAALMTQP